MKIRTLSIAAAAMLAAVSLDAAEPMAGPSDRVIDERYEYDPYLTVRPEGIFLGQSQWKVSGDIRTGWVRYDYDNPDGKPTINKGHKDSKGFYFVPKVSIESPVYNGWSGKITGAGATDFGLNDPDDETRTFVTPQGKSYAILQEAYIQYKSDEHEAAVGAKEIVTPMIDADDWYMLADTFQTAYYINKQIDHLKFGVAYFYKMAGPWDSGAKSPESYDSMSQASFLPGAVKDKIGDKGVYTAAAVYSDGPHNLQVWDYYGEDMYNILFAQYDFTDETEGFAYDFGAQFIHFSDVGDTEDLAHSGLFEGIDYSIYSLRFDGSFDNGFDFATGASCYTDGPGTGETLGAWGGYPYFANGMIFHFFESGSLRNADSYKAQLGYDLGGLNMPGLWAGVRYTYFDLDSDYSIASDGEPQDAMKMLGLRLSYKNDKGLYLTATYEGVDLDHEPNISGFRLIGGWTF